MRATVITILLLVIFPLCSCWVNSGSSFRTRTNSADGISRFRKLPHHSYGGFDTHTHLPSQIRLLANANDSEQQEIRPAALTPEEEAEKVLIERVQREVLEETGSELEDLINPSKVISLERELVALSAELDKTSELQARADIEMKMSKKRDVLSVEKRAVMRSWLKNLFVAQSIIALVISAVLVSPFYVFCATT